MALKAFRFRDLLLMAFVLSLGFIVIYNFLGFLFYPGLVKDLTPFSLDHLVRVCFFFAIIFTLHLGLVLIAYTVKRVA
jgi:hypothetical protein